MNGWQHDLSNSKFPTYVPGKAEAFNIQRETDTLELSGYAEAKKGSTRMSS